MGLAGPPAAPGPGLEERHAEEEDAGDLQDPLPEPGRLPRAVRKGDQQPGGDVQDGGSRCTGEDAAALAEDAPERLAEGPDDEAPPRPHQSRRPGPVAPRRDEEEDADPHLDPDGRGRRRNRVVGPDRGTHVHQVLDPTRGGAGGRGEDATGQPQGHRRLRLEKAVQDPQQAEGHPEQAAGGRLGVGPAGRHLGADRAGRHGLLEPDGAHGVPRQDEHDGQDHEDRQVVEERAVEGGGHGRIVGGQTLPHARHIGCAPRFVGSGGGTPSRTVASTSGASSPRAVNSAECRSRGMPI